MATSIYTPGGGWSPQGQQFNQGVNQQISIAQTKLASGQTLTPQESQALQDTYGQVAGESTRMQTSGARQQYIDQTNVSGMQSNYDDLARKLAGYDQMVLAPEFSNTNPGQPSDIPQSPDVSWGDISALTPEAAARPSGTGLYNSNPWYAMSSQIDQGNSLVNLLGTLNNTIGRETARGTNRYTSDLRALTSALDPIAQLMKLNSDYELEKMRISASRSSGAAGKTDLIGRFGSLLSSRAGMDGYVSPDDYRNIKRQASIQGVAPEDFDLQFSTFRNPENPYYQVEAGASGLTAEMRNRRESLKPAKVAVESFGQDQLKGMGPQNEISKFLIDKVGGLGVPQDIVSANQRFELLKQQVVRAMQGARMSDTDIEMAKNYIPSIIDTPETARTKLNNLVIFIDNLTGIKNTGVELGGGDWQ